MGITTEEFFQNIYNVMFSPKDFFENENLAISTRLAIFVVIVISAIKKTGYSISDNSINGLMFFAALVKSIICSILIWLIIAVLFEYVAAIFNKDGNLRKLLFLTAFASMPVIFFAPLSIIKQMGQYGYYLSIILGCLLYFWIFILYAKSIKNTYNITLARAFMFIFIPIISLVPVVYQIVGFSHNMWYIFSI